MRSDTGSAEPATLTARAVVTVQTGNVFLYDQNTTGVAEAQKLVLAATRDIAASRTATAEFFAVGSLTVTKSISGEAAGDQGDVSISIDCGTGYQFTLAVPAGTTADTSVSGATDTIGVATELPDPLTIPAGDGVEATVINEYSFDPGTVIVTKAISGEGAGSQGKCPLTSAAWWMTCQQRRDRSRSRPAPREAIPRSFPECRRDRNARSPKRRMAAMKRLEPRQPCRHQSPSVPAARES